MERGRTRQQFFANIDRPTHIFLLCRWFEWEGILADHPLQCHPFYNSHQGYWLAFIDRWMDRLSLCWARITIIFFKYLSRSFLLINHPAGWNWALKRLGVVANKQRCCSGCCIIPHNTPCISQHDACLALFTLCQVLPWGWTSKSRHQFFPQHQINGKWSTSSGTKNVPLHQIAQ